MLVCLLLIVAQQDLFFFDQGSGDTYRLWALTLQLATKGLCL